MYPTLSFTLSSVQSINMFLVHSILSSLPIKSMTKIRHTLVGHTKLSIKISLAKLPVPVMTKRHANESLPEEHGAEDRVADVKA